MMPEQIIFKGSDCPVCGEYHDNYCRTLGDLFLCRSGATTQQDSSGFKFIKLTTCQTWGIYKLQGKINQPKPQKREPGETKPLCLEALQTFYDILPPSTPNHPDLIHRRILPHTCDRLRVLTSDRLLAEDLKASLPAIAPPGLYIPAFNIQQKPIGYQYIPKDRKTHTENPLPKYLWLSKNGSAKLNDEYPLNFVDRQSKRILLCEGLLKSHLIADNFNLTTIGAASGNFLQSWQQLKAAIAFAKPSHVYFAADAGSRSNPSVWHKIKKLASLLPALKVMNYGQLDLEQKADPDDLDNKKINQILSNL
jgi:hypothetical protein